MVHQVLNRYCTALQRICGGHPHEVRVLATSCGLILLLKVGQVFAFLVRYVIYPVVVREGPVECMSSSHCAKYTEPRITSVLELREVRVPIVPSRVVYRVRLHCRRCQPPNTFYRKVVVSTSLEEHVDELPEVFETVRCPVFGGLKGLPLADGVINVFPYELDPPFVDAELDSHRILFSNGLG